MTVCRRVNARWGGVAVADPGRGPRGGGTNSPGGVLTYAFWAKFSQKLGMKLKEFGRRWGARVQNSYYVDPPLGRENGEGFTPPLEGSRL